MIRREFTPMGICANCGKRYAVHYPAPKPGESITILPDDFVHLCSLKCQNEWKEKHPDD